MCVYKQAGVGVCVCLSVCISMYVMYPFIEYFIADYSFVVVGWPDKIYKNDMT